MAATSSAGISPCGSSPGPDCCPSAVRASHSARFRVVKDKSPRCLPGRRGTKVHMEIEVVVEIPKGTRNKYEADHETGSIWLDRMLFTATRYPEDYGYVPETLARDGDPLDALVVLEE